MQVPMLSADILFSDSFIKISRSIEKIGLKYKFNDVI